MSQLPATRGHYLRRKSKKCLSEEAFTHNHNTSFCSQKVHKIPVTIKNIRNSAPINILLCIPTLTHKIVFKRTNRICHKKTPSFLWSVTKASLEVTACSKPEQRCTKLRGTLQKSRYARSWKIVSHQTAPLSFNQEWKYLIIYCPFDFPVF